MSYLTYYSDSVSQSMWSLCGPLLQALFDWAIDYISEIMVPILNYISKVRAVNCCHVAVIENMFCSPHYFQDSATFLQISHNGQPLAILLLTIIEKTFQNDEYVTLICLQYIQ